MQPIINAIRWPFNRPLPSLKSVPYLPTLGAIITISLLSSGGAHSLHAAAQAAPKIDDSLPLFSITSGNQCVTFADAGLANKESVTLEILSNGLPKAAYLIWSGRDRDNRGDNTILVDGQPIVADVENHGESGGGSWWHTYASDITPLVEAQAHTAERLLFSISGLSIDQNSNGEDHGVGLMVIFDSIECGASETNFHFGLDSFKHSAPEPLYGPNSAVHCTAVEPSPVQRQVDLSIHIGGIESQDRNATIWIMTSAADIIPATLIDQEDALSYADPVGNVAEDRQWDRFATSIDIPSGHSQICTQVESTGENGVSGVLVSLLAQVRTVETSLPNTISGKVWIDADQDGFVDEDEEGASNVVVLLRNAAERTVLQAFVTGASGEYRFTGMSELTYVIDVAGELLDTEWVQVSDPDLLLDTETTIALTSGMAIGNVNFGFVTEPPMGTIAGVIWQDLNGDGLQNEPTDVGIADVAVILLDVDQNLVAEQITTESGEFEFSQLPLLDYRVQVRNESLAPNFLQTAESDNTLDGSVDVIFSDNLTKSDIQFGYGTKGEINGRLWLDANGDGLESIGESGINNALLLLTNDIGVGRVAATQNGGNYSFLDLQPGSYTLQVVEETISPELVSTYDGDETLDGTTSLEIAVSTELTDINFGYTSSTNNQAMSVPRIDLTGSTIDLTDEHALIEYLRTNLLIMDSVAPEAEDEPDSEVVPPDTNGEHESPEAEPPVTGTPDNEAPEVESPEVESPQGEQPENESPTPEDGGNGPSLSVVIHLPLIQ